MLCIECGNLLPEIGDSSTACKACGTLVSTWWDEESQTHRTNRESIFAVPPTMSRRKNTQTIEERGFQACLTCLELHFAPVGGLGPKAMPEVKKMIGNALDMSLNRAEVRECLAKNVDIWMRLNNIFNLSIPVLTARSLREPYSVNGTPNGADTPENSSLILKNYDSLAQDLTLLNSLLVISRNMLAIKETAQELCAAAQFDSAVRDLVVLCVNVTSKGYDGENVDEVSRIKLNEITELYKKLLVTSLQHMHNWTMGNDRFKMRFWCEMLFDGEYHNETIHEMPPDGLNVEKAYDEVKNWLRRHSQKDRVAAGLLEKYSNEVELSDTPGPLPIRDDDHTGVEITEESSTPVWKPELEDKYEQDRLYARVSHEIDIWWKNVRDRNYEGWVVMMESVERAIALAEACKENAMHRYMPRRNDHDEQHDHDGQYSQQPDGAEDGEDEIDDRSTHGEVGDDDEEEEDEDEDDESYVEGTLRGLLTEVPNILDTKQIEALHMTVKACVVDSMGSGLTPAGENLQKTRCKMFLALDCGKNLLREMLVFIAVWEQTDQHFIFQITAQIIESFHHNALLPYAWSSLRILKDIVSPAQTILLRLINYMFRARKDSPIYDDVRDYNRDAKLIHFLYNYFRCRVVPDCLALMYAQAQIRQEKGSPRDFPVDLWDMERAKDGLSQYLDLISVIAEISEMRPLLIEWEAVYELIALLKALEAGVVRKPLVEPNPPVPTNRRPSAEGMQPGGSRGTCIERPFEISAQVPLSQQSATHHETPHKFPWAGIKIQILVILTSLLAPTNARRNGSGNPTVQKQLLERGGIMPLLNCCVYDGHHEYLKERATLAIKFAMEGSEEAQKFVRDLVPIKAQHAHAQTQADNARPRPAVPGVTATEALARAEAAMKTASRGKARQPGAGSISASLEHELEEKSRQLEAAGELAKQGKVILEEAKEMILAQAQGVQIDPGEVDKMAQKVHGLQLGQNKVDKGGRT